MDKRKKTIEKKKYEKPILKSQVYMERGALACQKINPNFNPDLGVGNCESGGGNPLAEGVLS